MGFENTYFIFDSFDMQPSKETLKYKYNVKTKAEWKSLGYDFEVTDIGQPLRDRNKNYHFNKVDLSNFEIKEAISTGKKGILNPLLISNLYCQGVSFDEFISLPPSVKLYSEAIYEYSNNNYIMAFPLIEKAIKNIKDINFSEWECRYNELYFSLGCKLGKMDLLTKQLEYLKNDMDSFVHSNIESWLNTIIKYQQFDLINPMFVVVEDGLNHLVKSKSLKNRIYSTQSSEYYKNVLNGLPKIKEKYNFKVEKFIKQSSGKEICVNEVNKIVYDFTQTFLSNYIKDQKYFPELENKIFSLMHEDYLNKNIIERLNKNECNMLGLLLTQYIMFFTTNETLKFPPWFLFDKRKDTIPYNILLYILDHKWPYPQMLNK